MALSDRQLLDALSRMPFIDTAELARILGEAHATIHRALTGLLAEGIVGRVSHTTSRPSHAPNVVLIVGTAPTIPRIRSRVRLLPEQSNRSKRRDGFRRHLSAAGPPILRNQTRCNHPFYRPAEIRMCQDRASAAPRGTIFVTDDPRPSREVGRRGQLHTVAMATLDAAGHVHQLGTSRSALVDAASWHDRRRGNRASSPCGRTTAGPSKSGRGGRVRTRPRPV